jgi:hypothetical protein
LCDFFIFWGVEMIWSFFLVCFFPDFQRANNQGLGREGCRRNTFVVVDVFIVVVVVVVVEKGYSRHTLTRFAAGRGGISIRWIRWNIVARGKEKNAAVQWKREREGCF